MQSAQAASISKNPFFAAQYERLSIRRGANRAKVAVAYSMLIAIWHMLTFNVPFKDLGSTYYNEFNKERKINTLLSKLHALGANAGLIDKEGNINPIIEGAIAALAE